MLEYVTLTFSTHMLSFYICGGGWDILWIFLGNGEGGKWEKKLSILGLFTRRVFVGQYKEMKAEMRFWRVCRVVMRDELSNHTKHKYFFLTILIKTF